MRQLGCNVQALRSGSKALAHLRTQSAGYDLLVLDVMMPHPTGIEVYRQLVDQGTRLPTVFVSGYGEQHLIEEVADRDGVVFLQKPFRQHELEDALARCLQSSSGLRLRRGADAGALPPAGAPASDPRDADSSRGSESPPG
jgi:FixJ family two-component response regulator